MQHTHYLKPSFLLLFYAAFVLTGLPGCSSKPDTEEKQDATTEAAPTDSRVVTIVTESMDFQVQDTITSGWTTFKYINRSGEPHFFLLERYPEGKTLQDAEHQVAPVFQEAMNLINEGKAKEGYAKFEELPEWYGKIIFDGGSGLLSKGKTTTATMFMEPGYYVMECYVKMPNGTFHSTMGMVEDIYVREGKQEGSEPEADVNITLSSEEGMLILDSIKAGKQTFAVYYQDQKVHENFVGHDVNLVKLSEGANPEALEAWMNWSDPKGLISPSPEGVTFMGGLNEMPAGNKGYFTADLSPGDYILISEVPNASEKNLMQKFTVN